MDKFSSSFQIFIYCPQLFNFFFRFPGSPSCSWSEAWEARLAGAQPQHLVLHTRKKTTELLIRFLTGKNTGIYTNIAWFSHAKCVPENFFVFFCKYIILLFSQIFSSWFILIFLFVKIVFWLSVLEYFLSWELLSCLYIHCGHFSRLILSFLISVLGSDQ